MTAISQTDASGGLEMNPDEIFSGEMEIQVTAPFDSAYIIQIMRQLQKHGCRIRYSTGSFRDGSLMALSIDEPTDVVSLLSEVPGTKKVEVTHRPADITGTSGQHPLQRLLDMDTDVYQITIVPKYRTSAGDKGRWPQGVASRDKSGSNDSDIEHAYQSGGVSEEGWARRLTYDIRNTALKRASRRGYKN